MAPHGLARRRPRLHLLGLADTRRHARQPARTRRRLLAPVAGDPVHGGASVARVIVKAAVIEEPVAPGRFYIQCPCGLMPPAYMGALYCGGGTHYHEVGWVLRPGR